MTLNPSKVWFAKFNGTMMGFAQTPHNSNDYEEFQNQPFAATLKIINVNADLTVQFIKGPSELLGKKTSQFAARELNQALREKTFLTDNDGIYLEGVWVFAKRGSYVRLIPYKT